MNMHRQTLNLGVAGLLQFTPKGETHAALAPDDGTTTCDSPSDYTIFDMRMHVIKRMLIHRRYESFHRFTTKDAQTKKKVVLIF